MHKDETSRNPRAPLILLAAWVAAGMLAAACQKKESPSANAPAAAAAKEEGPSKGVGPISHVEVGAVDAALAAKGEKIFSGTCSACHKMDQRYVGPALSGVTKRRSPEWIMNMIMNPAGMTQEDPVAKALLAEYMTQMSVNATEDDARALLEYFRKLDG
jgi:mono/diheme cytochrome c family protein